MKEMARVPRKRMEEKSLKSIKNHPQKIYQTLTKFDLEGKKQ
jgi:hypothetical protein